MRESRSAVAASGLLSPPATARTTSDSRRVSPSSTASSFLTDRLGTPEIGLQRSQTYQLIEIYEELVVKRGVSQEELAALEMSKLSVILPALRKDEVELDDALSDCESLSRSELREKYGQSVPAERIPLTECEECGKMCREKSKAEGEEMIPGQTSLEEANKS